jgi:cytochrome P450
VIAVIVVSQPDPGLFSNPARPDLRRSDNRRLAAGWDGHFCICALLDCLGRQIVFVTLLRRLAALALQITHREWCESLGLRGLARLRVSLSAEAHALATAA